MFYHELVGKIEEHNGKIYLMVDDIKILIEIDDKLSEDVALKNIVILVTSIIKDDFIIL